MSMLPMRRATSDSAGLTLLHALQKGNTALHGAAENGSLENVKLLIFARADPLMLNRVRS